MISTTDQLDILSVETEGAICIPVNCIGVPGRGLALAAAQKFPKWRADYIRSCQPDAPDRLEVGTIHVFCNQDNDGPDWILSVPTKTDWRKRSTYELVGASIRALNDTIALYEFPEVYIPALGCGEGGLAWKMVHKMLLSYLKHENSEIFLIPPQTP